MACGYRSTAGYPSLAIPRGLGDLYGLLVNLTASWLPLLLLSSGVETALQMLACHLGRLGNCENIMAQTHIAWVQILGMDATFKPGDTPVIWHAKAQQDGVGMLQSRNAGFALT